MARKLLLIFESSFEVNREAVAQLEKVLKDNGWDNRKFNELFDLASKKNKEQQSNQGHGGLRPSFGQSQEKSKKTTGDIYLELLRAEAEKYKPKETIDLSDTSEITDVDIPGHIPADQFKDSEIGSGPKEKPIRDESVIDALKLLAVNLGPMGRDKAIVIAARLGIDSELIEGAGFGTLPSNYTDSDVWNILKMSKDKAGKPTPFYDGAWQPFYIDAIEDLKDLPHDVREHIVEILTSEEPRETTYPTSDKNSLVDDPVRNPSIKKVYEAKLVKDLVIESSNGMFVINAGSKIIIESVRILSAEETGVVVNSPGRHYQVGVLYDDGALKDAMEAAIRIARNHGYNKSPKFGIPERREDGLVTYFTFTK